MSFSKIHLLFWNIFCHLQVFGAVTWLTVYRALHIWDSNSNFRTPSSRHTLAFPAFFLPLFNLPICILLSVFWRRSDRDSGIIHSQYTEITLPIPPSFDIVLYINVRLSPASWTIDHLVPQEGGPGNLLAAIGLEHLSDIEVDV